MGEDYRAVNRANWDERAAAHAASPDYALSSLREDPTFLSGVVRFDLPRLGDISGRSGVHLQCHIGTDTVSLARLGAKMAGLDFSSRSLDEARRLAEELELDIDFVQSDLYGAVEALGGRSFDLVYTGIGALCWLPSIGRWADVVAELLAPGGRLFLREAHPMLWTLEDGREDDLLVARYSYFEHDEPDVFTEEGTYVETAETFKANTTHTWNHGIGELITALISRGLRITAFEEHESVPWDALPGQMDKLELGEYRLRDRPWRVPHTYTLQAVKD
jgi:SAM-dependent methyltransferase